MNPRDNRKDRLPSPRTALYLHCQSKSTPVNSSPPLPLARARRARQFGFSLIEVALAIAVVAFAFVALLGMLPAGLTTFRRALDISICTGIAQRIVSDAQGADFDIVTDQAHLPDADGTLATEFSFRAPSAKEGEGNGVRFFDEQGNEIVKPDGKIFKAVADLDAGQRFKAVYHVNTRIVPRYTPPRGDDTTGVLNTERKEHTGSLALMTIQIAHNPGSVDLEMSKDPADDPTKPQRNLWKLRPGVDIFTYSAYIARNQ